MENKLMKVKKGGSTNVFTVTREGTTDYTDYKMKVVVLDPVTLLSTGVSKVLLPDVSAGFSVGFSPGETNTLGKGSFLVVAEMYHDPVGNGDINDFTYSREVSWQLEVKDSLISI